MDEEGLLVKFRFDGDPVAQIGKFTRKQYNNLKSLPIVVECKTITDEKPTLSAAEVEILNKKILEACQSDASHTSKLSK